VGHGPGITPGKVYLRVEKTSESYLLEEEQE